MSESPTKSAGKSKSPLLVIFSTVFVDLVGFGMVIPLIGLYGRHFGASGAQLAVLGAIFSVLQFFFTPFWGALSDRIGRRPVILISLLGSTVSYAIFAYAPNFTWLLVSRAFGGLFAANISAAQAYIADVTKPEDRAKGMGLIGAAFGIGFTLGPPLGGIAAKHWGLAAPGLIAATICGINLLLAVVRLPESLSKDLRAKASQRSLSPIQIGRLIDAAKHPELLYLLLAWFFVTFAFSNMEQTFSLLFQDKFQYTTETAGYHTGLILMVSGLLGALIQGGAIRKLVPKYGERRLVQIGLFLNCIALMIFPYGPTFAAYFLIILPLSIGTALLNPSINALISRSASATEQGATLGLAQGLGSLARALGPFCGLLTFQIHHSIPYFIAAFIEFGLLLMARSVWSRLPKRVTT